MLPLPELIVPYFEKDGRLKKLLLDLEPYLDNSDVFPHHSWDEHFCRVLRNCLIIAKEERLSEDRTSLVIAAALLHDVGYRIPQRKGRHLELSHQWAREHCAEYGYGPEEIEILADAVLFHDHKLGEPCHDVGKVLHDADSLEKAPVTARLFGAAVDSQHPLRREVAHKCLNTLDYARAYLMRMEPLADGGYFYTVSGRRLNNGRVELIKKVFETYIAEQEGTLLV